MQWIWFGAPVLVVLAFTARWIFGSCQPNVSQQSLKTVLNGSQEVDCIWSNQQILVLVNPLGGGGKALRVWESIVRPVLQQANIKFIIRKTQRAGHAYAIVAADEELKQCSGIISISGDGMLHEIVNGLRKRCRNSSENLKKLSSQLPLCVIPAGTMNGVSTSLGAKTPEQALLNLLQCQEAKPVDAFEATFADGHTIIDLHAMSCCITADHDNIVERQLRWAGSFLRTTLAPLIVIAKNRFYEADLFIQAPPLKNEDKALDGLSDPVLLPICENMKTNDSSEPWRRITGPLSMACLMNTKCAAHDMIMAPAATPSDAFLHLIVVRGNVLSRVGMISLFLSLTDGSHVKNPAVDYYRVQVRRRVFKPKTLPS